MEAEDFCSVFSSKRVILQERATLKHRNGGKHIQQLARYASKNEEFKKTFEEQIRLGRELAEKHGREKDSDADLSASEDESTDPVKLSSAEMLQVSCS